MPRIRKLVVVVATLIVALPMAAWAQLDADERPTTRGPIATGPQLKSCKSEPVRGEGGRVLARFRVCSRYYLFDPASETDTSRDHGAFWIQVQADASRGICVKRIRTTLRYSRGVRAKAPKVGTTVRAKKKKKKRYVTRLEVDAQGATDTPARIRNGFVLRGGRMAADSINGGYRLSWRGSSGGELGFAAGLELSWPDTGDAPRVKPEIRARLSREC
jgi:hypothetical protein